MRELKGHRTEYVIRANLNDELAAKNPEEEPQPMVSDGAITMPDTTRRLRTKKWYVGLAAVVAALAMALAAILIRYVIPGKDLSFGSDVTRICMDWTDDSQLAFGMYALESQRGRTLTDFRVTPNNLENIQVESLWAVQHAEGDPGGSAGPAEMFEHEMSLWDERVPFEELVVEPGELWFLYIYTSPIEELDTTTVEGITVLYRNGTGLTRFQTSNLGFGKARPGTPCFPNMDGPDTD